MNAKNIATGTVHNATVRAGDIVQTCGIRASQRVSLVETDEPVTCSKCSKSAPKATATRKPAAKSTGPATWLVVNAAGETMTFRTTKRDAQQVADRIGSGASVRKA